VTIPSEKRWTARVVILNGIREVSNPGMLRCAQNDRWATCRGSSTIAPGPRRPVLELPCRPSELRELQSRLGLSQAGLEGFQAQLQQPEARSEGLRTQLRKPPLESWRHRQTKSRQQGPKLQQPQPELRESQLELREPQLELRRMLSESQRLSGSAGKAAAGRSAAKGM
jgi:hypothetical protein